MKIKRLLSLMLSVIMLIASAGCVGDSGEADPAVNQGGTNTGNEGGSETGGGLIQLVVYSQTANYSGKIGGWFAKILRDKFNAEITIIPQPDPGIFDTRMETGNLGDIIIFGSNGDQYQRAINEGMLFDWNEDDTLAEFGSYIYENMQGALENNADLSERVTGKRTVYGFGHDLATSNGDIVAPIYTWDIRWDIYKELGYPEIKNLDDLFDVFVAMKELYPTDINGNPTYAVSMWPDWDDNLIMYVKSFATSYWGYDEFDFGLYNVETGEFYFVADEGSPYIESLRYFNRLSRAGLVDPNSPAQTYDEMSKKMNADAIFYSLFNYAGSMPYNTVSTDTVEGNLPQGKYMYSLIPEDATPWAEAMSVKGGTRVWAIGAKSEYPELCMEILNWLSTPEGTMTYYYGPEGLCWYYDDDGYTCFTEYGEAAYRDARNTTVPAEWGGGNHNEGSFQANNTIWSRNATNPDSIHGETFNAVGWTSRRLGAEYDIQQDWMDYTGFYDYEEYFKSRTHTTDLKTASGFVADKKSTELTLIWNQMKIVVKDQSWKAIFAETEEEFEKEIEILRNQINDYDPAGECKAYSMEQAAKRHALEEAVRALG